MIYGQLNRRPTVHRSTSQHQLTQWQHAITAGNQAFAIGDSDSAHRAYLYGLSLAQSLLRDSRIADNAIAALVTTYHNLADLHQRAGHLDLAADQLCAIHRQLMRLADVGALHNAAMHHQRRTQLELMRFIAEHPQYGHLIQTLGMSHAQGILH
ncbi:hypothetical protein [Deefgea rivuli]|uniref:hypothetical protein n=1 Tax=Deefgea rivuli TaxID=400948 RepID=UPI000687CA61|nr:hypothetical protein [Deefgea rivuli]